MYLTKKKKLGPVGSSEQLDNLRRACAVVWNDTVRWFWRTVDRQDLWLGKHQMMRWMCTRSVNGSPNPIADTASRRSIAQNTAQNVVKEFFQALDSWRAQNDPDANPPHNLKGYYKANWNYTQIRLRNDAVLRLSMGRGNDPVLIDWPHPEPKRVEIGESDGQYDLRAQYKAEPDRSPISDKTAGIDLGEVHLAAATDGEQTWLINGRYLRSLRHYQNKTKAILQSKIDKKVEGSRRWKRLVTSKNEQLSSLRNQTRDVLHKLSRRLVETLYDAGVSTLVIGDVRNIRDGMDYGAKDNQRLHQWAHGTFRQMLTYKARLAGMTVELESEGYTSQTCPACGHRHKPSGREYTCSNCGAKFHRDEVGALNIRQKYLDGDGWQDGYLSSPVPADKGSTATARRQCSSPRGGKTNQVNLFASGHPDSSESVAPSPTRETPHRGKVPPHARITEHPVGIPYRPHMNCGTRGSPAISSQG